MQHARDRPRAPGADIGRGACNGAGDAKAAEQSRTDIGKALRDQLAIGAMAAAVMPSATTADNSDSIAPSRANAIASGSTARIFSNENAGSAGIGNCRGMPPKRVPMVSTGRASAQAANAARTTAIKIPGQCGRSRRSTTMMRHWRCKRDRRKHWRWAAARQRLQLRDELAGLLCR
jgi:hypothetical protein